LVVPLEANGVYSLQVFGSSTQPLLQIVPVLTRLDFNGSLLLYGAGFVEGSSQYSVGGVSVGDTVVNNGVDVSYYYDSARGAYIYGGLATLDSADLASYGFGNVIVTTAGGTSAAVALNQLKLNIAGTDPGDVAVNAAGQLWVSDYTNPGHLLKIDPATGQALASIDLTAAYGTPYTYNYAGLQILPQAMSLNGTTVPAGSLLVFNGYANPDRIIAVNPGTGAVIASLVLGANYDLTAGLYDSASGHLFILSHNSNAMIEINPANGTNLGQYGLPVSVQSWAGIAIDPVDGNFWIGSTSSGTEVVKVNRSGVELQRVDLSSQLVNSNTISGLAFNPDGSLMVSTTQGAVVKVVA
jgi:hypothetical protein